MAGFSHQVRTDDGMTIVEAAGDVDMSVAGQLSETLEPLITAQASVVLDCSGVTFFDSMGLRVVVLAIQRAKEVGAAFALVPSASVTRVLELAGISEVCTVYDNVSEVPR